MKSSCSAGPVGDDKADANVFASNASGIPELDNLMVGKPFAVVGNLSLRRRDRYTSTIGAPLKDWPAVELLLHESPLSRASANIFLRFAASRHTVEVVYDALDKALLSRSALFCVGSTTDGSILCYIKKEDNAKPPSFAVLDEVPATYTFRRGGGVCRQQQSLLSFSQSLSKSVTNMSIARPQSDDEITFEQLYKAMERFSSAELTVVKTTIEMKLPKHRSPTEQMIMRVFGGLMKVRADRTNPIRDALVWSAAEPPMPVVPFKFLLNLTQVGLRLEEQTLRTERFRLAELFTNPRLMSEYVIILMGSNATTGCGKTEFAKLLACHWSKLMCEAMQLHPSEAKVCFTTTLESAKDVAFQQGMSWILDEFAPNDGDQIQYASENMLKVLFSPVAAGNLRARNSNINFPAGVSRIITTNANSPEEWCGKPLDWSFPLRRTCILFQITKPLVVRNWSKHADYVPSAAESSNVLPVARAAELLASRPSPLPAEALIEPVRLISNSWCALA